MTSLVSILIPAYNAERWIGETLSSALGQTWPRKEMIVVDDGSKDGTFEVASRSRRRKSRSSTQPNTGAPGARNTALRTGAGRLHPVAGRRRLAASRQDRAPDGAAGRRRRPRRCSPRHGAGSSSAPIEGALRARRAVAGPVAGRMDARALQRQRVDESGGVAGQSPPHARSPARGTLGWLSSGDDDGEYICRMARPARACSFVPDALCYYRIGTVGSLNWNMEIQRRQPGVVAAVAAAVDRTPAGAREQRAHEGGGAAAPAHLLRLFLRAPERYLARLAALAQRAWAARSRRRSWAGSTPLWRRALGPQATRAVIAQLASQPSC